MSRIELQSKRPQLLEDLNSLTPQPVVIIFLGFCLHLCVQRPRRVGDIGRVRRAHAFSEGVMGSLETFQLLEGVLIQMFLEKSFLLKIN